MLRNEINPLVLICIHAARTGEFTHTTLILGQGWACCVHVSRRRHKLKIPPSYRLTRCINKYQTHCLIVIAIAESVAPSLLSLGTTFIQIAVQHKSNARHMSASKSVSRCFYCICEAICLSHTTAAGAPQRGKNLQCFASTLTHSSSMALGWHCWSPCAHVDGEKALKLIL